MQLTQGLRRNARLLGSTTATICGNRSTSWAQFADRVARVVGGWPERGISIRDRVIILAHNSDRYMEALATVLLLPGASGRPIGRAIGRAYGIRGTVCSTRIASTDPMPPYETISAWFENLARRRAARRIRDE